MKALIVYDSIHGNTGEIATAISAALGAAISTAISGDVRVIKASEAGPSDLESLDVLIAGSPTYAGRPTPAMLEFLAKVPDASLKNVSVAGFDTRVPAMWVKIFGFAAGKISKSLKSRGGTAVIKPEGFFVKGTKGPLVDGEAERAAGWARDIISGIEHR